MVALITVLYGIHDRTQFYASKLIDASTLTIIWQLVPVVAFATALVFLHESVTLQKILAAFLIIGGNLLVVYRHPALKANRGLVYALVATVAVGFAIGLNKQVSSTFSLPLYSVIAFFFPSLYNGLLPPLPFKTLAREWKLAGWAIVFLAAVNMLQFFLSLLAYRLTDASRVIPVASSSTVLVVLSGIIFLHERSHVIKKIAAAICVFVGIVLISV